jgi:hypothetical protein
MRVCSVVSFGTLLFGWLAGKELVGSTPQVYRMFRRVYYENVSEKLLCMNNNRQNVAAQFREACFKKGFRKSMKRKNSWGVYYGYLRRRDACSNIGKTGTANLVPSPEFVDNCCERVLAAATS